MLSFEQYTDYIYKKSKDIIKNDDINAFKNNIELQDRIKRTLIIDIINCESYKLFDYLLNSGYKIEDNKLSYFNLVDLIVSKNNIEFLKIYLKYNQTISHSLLNSIKICKNYDFLIYILDNYEINEEILLCIDSLYSIVDLNKSFWRKILFSIDLSNAPRLKLLVKTKKDKLLRIRKWLNENVDKCYDDISSIIVEYL